MVTLLTNIDGFSAKLDETVPGSTRHLSGELIGREGRLIFQPTRAKRKKDKDATGLFFIWDSKRENGFVLSEELQGYAPVSSNLKVTNVSMTPAAPPTETIGEHPCHHVEVALSLADGGTARFEEWLADDLKQFPVRIHAINSRVPATVSFSEVRLELAAPQLFNPPQGFTQYANAVALMNELMMRQSTLKQRPGELENQMPTTGDTGWGVGSPQPTVR